ncbi:garp complex component [Colletotrichum sojae]|uniref:Garp complex component n=1 Tax=Colletotrichum sojae TaxID=2175907 RepID=A0A8H6IMR3_9PEZI|nr:garp complex component [Colletotrichum sojae]
MGDFERSRRDSTISLTHSVAGHLDTWAESYPANVFDPAHNAISSLLQPPIVRTCARPHTYAPTSSLHKIPTARDIIPVALTAIPTVETTEFQPYLLQVGTLYEQLLQLKNKRDGSTKPHGKWLDGSSGGNTVPRVVPNVYFDEDFRLENPRTFHVVTEKSEVITPKPTTVAAQDGDEPAPRKALATNAILQEKLSWYMDAVEVHLIDSISMASTKFFPALGSLQELHTEAAESVEKVRALREILAALDKDLGDEGLGLLQKQQKFSNLRQLNDAVSQIEHIVDGIARCESLVDEGEVDKALAEIDVVELLMSGERHATTRLTSAGDTHLRDLRGAVALQGVVEDLNVLRSRIGKVIESKVHDIFLRDLRRHIDAVSTPEVLQRWGAASQRVKGNYPREPSSLPAYMLLTDALRTTLSPQISGLDRSRSISTAIQAYPANIRALDAADAEKLLSNIFIGVTETLRRLKTQSSVLLDLACTIRKPDLEPLNSNLDTQPPTFEIQEEMHLALDLSNLLGQAVDVSHEKISKILRVRSEQTARLPLAYFIRYFTLNLYFVNECEAISGRTGTSLNNIVNDHIQAFIEAHGEGKSQALTRGMDVDNWQVKDYTAKDNVILQQILECSTSDPPAWVDASKVWMPPSQGDADEAHAAGKVTAEGTGGRAIIDKETFQLPHLAMLCLEGISDFLRLLNGIPSRTLDIVMSLVSYIQLFDYRCRQLVLGAGALRSAGLKNISTAHLALASQAVSFIATTIPYIREFVRRHRPTGQSSAKLMGEFDKVRRGLQEHHDAIFQKMVDMMVSRASALCKKALETEWDNESPEGVRKYMADLVRDTSKLHKVLVKYLPPQSVGQVMVPVFASYGEQLGNAFEKADPKTETGRECMVRDVGHLASKLDKFEGFGDLDAKLKQIVESRGI